MVRELRKGNSHYGLVLANGGMMTYQHVVCLSSLPRNDGSPYPAKNPLPDVITDVPVPTVDGEAEGEATIEVSLAVHSMSIQNCVLTVTGADLHGRIQSGWHSFTRAHYRSLEEKRSSFHCQSRRHGYFASALKRVQRTNRKKWMGDKFKRKKLVHV